MSKARAFLFAAIALSAALLSAYAYAVEDLGEIRVVAPAESLFSRALPGESVQVLKREDWEGRALTIAEVLEEAAGVIVTRTGGRGSLTTVGLRGATGNQVLVMLNGVPISLPGGLAVDLSLLDLKGVERIEVIRGGATYGSRAVGGIINIITRGQRAETAASLRLSLGSFGTRDVSWQRARSYADGQDFLHLSGFSTEGNFSFASVNGEIRTRRNNHARRVNVLWERQRFSADSLSSSFANLEVMQRGVPGFAEFPTERAELTEALGTAGWNQIREPAKKDAWAREVNLSLSSGYLRFRDPEPAMGEPIRSRVADAALRGELTFREQPPSAESPRTQLSLALSERMLNGSDYGSRHETRGEISLARNFSLGRTSITPGVNATMAEGRDVNASWEIALQHPIGDRFWLSGNAGRSFRFPDMSELYYPNQGYIRGNPDLGSERALFADIGIEMKQRGFAASLHAFRRRQENTIKFVPVSAYTIEPRNLPSVRVSGIEAEASMRLGKQLNASASYTFTRARFRESGLPLTQTPKHKVAAVLNYNNGALNLSASHLRESEQTSDLFGSIRVPAKQSTSLSASWRGKHNEWSLAVENLFDEDGRDFWDLPLPGRYIEIGFKRSI